MGQQFLVAATLDDFALDEDEHLIGIADRAQAVGDHKAGAISHDLLQSGLDLPLGARIDTTGRFIENQDAWLGQGGAGNREQLALPLAQAAAPFAQHSGIAIRQPLDELMGTCHFGRFDHFFVSGFGTTKTNVVHDRCAEEKGVLQDDANLPAQAAHRYITDINAINRHLATRGIIETGQQVDQCRLARAGGADNRNRLPRLGDQVDAAQHRFTALIFGAHAGIDHPPSDRWQFLGVEFLQDIGHLVDQLKDPFGTGNRALDIRPQHTELGNRLVKALDITQEGDDQTERHRRPAQRHITQQKEAAATRGNRNRQIAQCFQCR